MFKIPLKYKRVSCVRSSQIFVVIFISRHSHFGTYHSVLLMILGSLLRHRIFFSQRFKTNITVLRKSNCNFRKLGNMITGWVLSSCNFNYTKWVSDFVLWYLTASQTIPDIFVFLCFVFPQKHNQTFLMRMQDSFFRYTKAASCQIKAIWKICVRCWGKEFHTRHGN